MNVPGTLVVQSLQNTGALIVRAKGEATANPVQALHDLAAAQGYLRAIQSNALTNAQRQNVANLQKDMLSAVQAAMMQYNQKFAITPLVCSHPPPALHTPSNGVQQVQLTPLQAAKNFPVLYALGTDSQGKNGTVYAVSGTTLTPVAPFLPPTAPQVIAMAGNGQQLLLLSSSVSTGTQPQSYALSMYVPGQKKATPSVAVNAQSGSVPALVTASRSDVYVVVASPPPAASTTVFVYDYKIVQGKLSGNPEVETLTVPNIVSVVAFPHQQLFFLLADGSVHSLQFAPGSGALTSVYVLNAVPAPLTTSATTFTAQTPVPVASPLAQSGLQPLAIGANTTSSLAASQVGATQHLYVTDTYAHRLLDFTENTPTTPGGTPTASSGSSGNGAGTVGAGTATTSSSSVTLNLAGQYISPTLFAHLKSMVAAPDGSQWYVLAQDASSTLDLITVQTQTSPQPVCIS